MFITFLGIEILFIKQCPLKSMSGDIWLLTNIGVKRFSDLVIFSVFSSDISIDFHESIQVQPLKFLIYFLAGINTT